MSSPRVSQALLEVARPDMLAAKLDPQFERYAHSRLLAKKFRDLTYGTSPRQIWTMQPQLGKTTMGSIWGPAWALDWMPTISIMLLSYAARLSQRNARMVRNVFRDHARYLRTALATDSRAADIWHTTEGGGLLASGVDGSIHGFSGHIIIIDDPHKNRREANSAHRRQQVWEWWTDDVQSRLQGEERVLLVMTRWHPDDLVARIIAHDGTRRMVDGEWETVTPPEERPDDDGKWEVTHIPALADPDICDPDPLGREPGEPACPERFPREVMEDRKISVGPIAWSSLYQGRPTVAEGHLLKRSWWRLMQSHPSLSWGDLLISSWDLAGGDTSDLPGSKRKKKAKGKSWTVGQVWMKDRHQQGNKIRYTLLEEVRGQWNLPQQLDAIRDVADRYGDQMTHHLIENASNGRSALQQLAGEISGLVAIDPINDGSKYDRAESTTPTLARGEIWLPNYIGTDAEINDEKTWVDKFINECADFPNGETDDRVDAYSQAINWFLRRGHRNESGESIEFEDDRGR